MKTYTADREHVLTTHNTIWSALFKLAIFLQMKIASVPLPSQMAAYLPWVSSCTDKWTDFKWASGPHSLLPWTTPSDTTLLTPKAKDVLSGRPRTISIRSITPNKRLQNLGHDFGTTNSCCTMISVRIPNIAAHPEFWWIRPFKLPRRWSQCHRHDHPR